MDDFLTLAGFIMAFVVWMLIAGAPEVLGGLLDGSLKKQADAEAREKEDRLKAMTDLADQAIAARRNNEPLPPRGDL
jgi:hypothetical protein